MNPTDFDTAKLGRLLYEAYGTDAQHKNHRGEPMPHWLDLTQETREHWRVAASTLTLVILDNVATSLRDYGIDANISYEIERDDDV